MSQAENQFAADDTQVRRIYDNEFEEHKSVVNVTIAAVRSGFTAALSIMEHSVRQGGKLLLFGNGGSAADAQHIVAELVVRYKSNRAAVAAIALTTDTSILTACGNDLGYDAIFERQIEALGKPGDVAIGISTSGKSPNVLRGLRQARSQGMKTVGLTGGTGGEMVGICDAAMTVPTPVTARIQEMHIILGHMLCLALEVRLGLV